MQHGWKNQPKFYLSISSYIYIYIPYLSSLIYIIPVWSFISISWACKSSSEKRTRYWRRKGGCLEWSLIRNHCLSFILAFPVVCVWEREREREIDHLEWKGVFGMRFDPRSSHQISSISPMFASWFTFINLFVITSLHAWDGTDLGPGFIPHTYLSL